MRTSRLFVHAIRRLITTPESLISRAILRANSVEVGDSVSVTGLIHVNNAGRISIGNNSKLVSGKIGNPVGGGSGLSLVTGKCGYISIGCDTGISNAEIFSASEITIGSRVLIGGGSRIYDTDFHPLAATDRTTNLPAISRPITIGDDVFVGAYSTLLKGIQIGQRSVVGAGSVVTKNIPPNEIWAGNPARFIRKLV